MLSLDGCLRRRERLWAAVPADVQWLLVADPRHVLYLSNFWVQPLSFSAGERGWLLLERGGKTTLLGDNFTLRSRSAEPFVDEEVVFKWYDHRRSVINRDHALFHAVEQVSERLYGRSGAVEAEWLPVGAFELLGLDHEAHSVKREATDGPYKTGAVDLGTVLRTLRRQKEPDEIALLKRCMVAGEAGMRRAREVIRAGVTEFEVYRAVQEAAVAALGCPGLVYGDFRACTATQPKVGGLPTDYALQNGDLYVLDFSVVLHGYRSDFTNAFAVGTPSPAQQQQFDLVLAAQKSGEKLLKAGVAARDVFSAVEKPIREAGLADQFAHHAGHGLGMGHPESPILVPDSTDTLLVGDVVTLEPGVYVAGVGGIRLEHNYLITETGYERLSQHELKL